MFFVVLADVKVSSPVNCEIPNRLYGGRSNSLATAKMNGPSSVCSSASENDQRSVGSEYYKIQKKEKNLQWA